MENLLPLLLGVGPVLWLQWQSATVLPAPCVAHQPGKGATNCEARKQCSAGSLKEVVNPAGTSCEALDVQFPPECV